MNLTPQKIERLEKILGAFDDGSVKAEELVQAIEAVMGVIDSTTARVLKELLAVRDSAKGDIESVERKLGQVQDRIASALEVVKSSANADTAAIRASFGAELARIQSLIPEMPSEFDASDLYEALQGHRTIIEQLQVLITGENVRNALEALPEGDKLAIDAIEGLRKALEEIRAIKGSERGATALIARYLYQIGDVNVSGVTDGQVLTYQASTNTWVPGTGGTGSFTVETPTGTVDGVNTVFTVTATPKWIVSDGITYFDGAGYSIAGLNVTMDVPPSQFNRAIS